jgi:hypothetical protein
MRNSKSKYNTINKRLKTYKSVNISFKRKNISNKKYYLKRKEKQKS